MRRVVFVAGRFPPDVSTGFSRAFARLVAHARRHASVRLVAGVRGRVELPPDTLRVRVPEGRVGRWVALWRGTRSLIADARPDVVVTAGVGLPPVGVPVVAVLPDLSQRGWRSPRGLRGATRLAARVPRAVVVATEVMRAQAEALGIAPERVHRAPIAQHRPPTPAPLPPRGHRLELLHPGTIHPSKAQHVSVDAVCRLPPEQRKRVHLTVAGPVHDDRYLAQLRGAARGQPITFVPEVDAVAPALAGCHVVLLPVATQMGFPDQALAALGAARPVVWSDVGAMPEVLQGQGVRVPADDVGAVRDVLVGLLEHRDLGALGVRGWQRAGDYTWDRLWERWDRLLDVG